MNFGCVVLKVRKSSIMVDWCIFGYVSSLNANVGSKEAAGRELMYVPPEACA